MAQRNKQAEQFEAMLRREVAGAAPPEPADCPGPQLLAAWYDRSVSPAERARVDSHLLGCARCQSAMALIARAEDAARASENVEAPGPWRWIARVLTSAPGAAASVAAIAIIVVLVVRNAEQPNPQPMTLAMRAPIEQPAAALPPIPAAAPPFNEAAPRAQARSPLAESAPVVAAATAPASAGAGAAGVGAVGAAAGASNFAAPEARSRVASKLGSALMASGSAPAAQVSNPLIEIYSPDGSVIWNIGRNGIIVNMRNGVAQVQRSGVATELLAGSATSNNICWVVGRSGTVLRTVDGGRHWMRAAAPSTQDLVSVDARGAVSASVTAANGDRFSTHDEGVSWSSL